MIVSVGVNDTTSLTRLSIWRQNLSELIAVLRRHSPHAVIAVAGIPPLSGFPLLPQPLRAIFGLRGRTFDDAAREIIRRHHNVTHAPLDFHPTPEQFSADGYHPSEASYREFGQMMAERIIKYVKAPQGTFNDSMGKCCDTIRI